MGKVPYPKEMMVSDEGKTLYGMWRRVRKNTDEFGLFASYPKFYTWAMDNYFCIGRKLRRYDESLPYSPENCVFVPGSPEDRPLTADQRKMASEWNRTVNVFRKACGLKLFEVTE